MKFRNKRDALIMIKTVSFVLFSLQLFTLSAAAVNIKNNIPPRLLLRHPPRCTKNGYVHTTFNIIQQSKEYTTKFIKHTRAQRDFGAKKQQCDEF